MKAIFSFLFLLSTFFSAAQTTVIIGSGGGSASPQTLVPGTGIAVTTSGNSTTITNTALGGTTSGSYSVTTLTGAALKAAWDALPDGGILTLVPSATYVAGSTVIFNTKRNVTVEGNGAWLLASTPILLSKAYSTTNCTFNNLKWANTANSTTSVAGLLLTNDEGENINLTLNNPEFTAPNLLTNGFTASQYSVQANGGSGQGKLLQGLKIYRGWFHDIGRCGVELVNHSWDDGKTTVYIKDTDLIDCVFTNTGTKSQTDGNNGMAFSNSGYAINTRLTRPRITDAKLLAIELAGTNGGFIEEPIITYANNATGTVGISVSDNAHYSTKNIKVRGGFVRTGSGQALHFNGAADYTIEGTTFRQDSTGNYAVYLQNSVRGTIAGLDVRGKTSNNLVRYDDVRETTISNCVLENTASNTYALISVYGSATAVNAPNNGSFDNKVGDGMIYRKYTGLATTGVFESYGNVARNTVEDFGGTLSATGNGSTTSFGVNTGLGYTPTFVQVSPSYTVGYSGYTISGQTVNFTYSTAPPNGQVLNFNYTVK